jgi:hypothetical protein
MEGLGRRASRAEACVQVKNPFTRITAPKQRGTNMIYALSIIAYYGSRVWGALGGEGLCPIAMQHVEHRLTEICEGWMSARNGACTQVM